MAEINLLAKYPQAKRNLDARRLEKTHEDRRIARQFGKEFFDGDRRHGYGGYNYNPKYWTDVVSDFQKHYGLTAKSSVLDIGCGKGFMLFDFVRLIPGITVEGIDISEYAVANSMDGVKPFVHVGSAKKLPYKDTSFDLVISINTVHNLPLDECKEAILEIQRVSKKDAFITVDAYRNEEEKKRMDMWNLTALTYMSVPEWEKLFREIGYTGDYYWFIP